MKTKKILLIGIMAALFLIPAIAYAALTPKSDVPTATSIKAHGNQITLNYNNMDGQIQTQVIATTLETIVTSEYGIAVIQNNFGGVTQPTVMKTYTYRASNEGNASDNYYITAKIVSFTGVAGFTGAGWLVSIESSGSVKATLAGAGDQATVMSGNIAEDADYPIEIVVVPSPDAIGSPNKATVKVQLTVSTESRPAAVYLGANGRTYGGTYESIDITLTTIESAVLKMSRVATVDAPATYIANGGDAHDAVPGSVITYTIIVSNEGSAYAKNVIVMDKVPLGTGSNASTESGHVGASSGTSPTLLPNVTLTNLPDASADSWRQYYSTQTNMLTEYATYGATGWVSLDAIAPHVNQIVGSSAAYVKWEIASFDGATGGNPNIAIFTWGVIIR